MHAQIIEHLKATGVFDQFRKDCIADVDTKPAYINLQNRVNFSVDEYLKKVHWSSKLVRISVRDKMRKHIIDQPYFSKGVDRVVDQAVDPKIFSTFSPIVENVVYEFLGLQKPKAETKEENEDDQQGWEQPMDIDTPQDSMDQDIKYDGSQNDGDSAAANVANGKDDFKVEAEEINMDEGNELLIAENSEENQEIETKQEEENVEVDVEDAEVVAEDDDEEESPPFEAIGLLSPVHPFPAPVGTEPSSTSSHSQDLVIKLEPHEENKVVTDFTNCFLKPDEDKELSSTEVSDQPETWREEKAFVEPLPLNEVLPPPPNADTEQKDRHKSSSDKYSSSSKYRRSSSHSHSRSKSRSDSRSRHRDGKSYDKSRHSDKDKARDKERDRERDREKDKDDKRKESSTSKYSSKSSSSKPSRHSSHSESSRRHSTDGKPSSDKKRSDDKRESSSTSKNNQSDRKASSSTNRDRSPSRSSSKKDNDRHKHSSSSSSRKSSSRHSEKDRSSARPKSSNENKDKTGSRNDKGRNDVFPDISTSCEVKVETFAPEGESLSNSLNIADQYSPDITGNMSTMSQVRYTSTESQQEESAQDRWYPSNAAEIANNARTTFSDQLPSSDLNTDAYGNSDSPEIEPLSPNVGSSKDNEFPYSYCQKTTDKSPEKAKVPSNYEGTSGESRSSDRNRTSTDSFVKYLKDIVKTDKFRAKRKHFNHIQHHMKSNIVLPLEVTPSPLSDHRVVLNNVRINDAIHVWLVHNGAQVELKRS